MYGRQVCFIVRTHEHSATLQQVRRPLRYCLGTCRGRSWGRSAPRTLAGAIHRHLSLVFSHVLCAICLVDGDWCRDKFEWRHDTRVQRPRNNRFRRKSAANLHPEPRSVTWLQVPPTLDNDQTDSVHHCTSSPGSAITTHYLESHVRQHHHPTRPHTKL